MRSAIREEVASIEPFDAIERAHRQCVLEFDDEEFHSVRWFRFDEAPLFRSDPHLPRFLAKLAPTGVVESNTA